MDLVLRRATDYLLLDVFRSSVKGRQFLNLTFSTLRILKMEMEFYRHLPVQQSDFFKTGVTFDHPGKIVRIFRTTSSRTAKFRRCWSSCEHLKCIDQKSKSSKLPPLFVKIRKIIAYADEICNFSDNRAE